MTIYFPKYKEWLDKAAITINELPIELQKLIEKYEQVRNVLEITDLDTHRLSFILAQTDAVICGNIYTMYKDRLPALPDPQEKVDKMKLIALRAKALKLKWEK